MSENTTVLIVEDARELAKLLSDYLLQENFQVHCLFEGTNAVEWVEQNCPDIILLDLMLPGLDGIEICKRVRSFSEVPIIMITARIEEQDRLLGLHLGADDYICKPFSPREVVARVKAVLRRTARNNEQVEVLHGIVRFDDQKMQASLNGRALSLTVVEFHLLKLLAEHPGRIFSRDQLIERIYQDGRIVSDRTIDSHVKKLRKKISEVYDRELIHSVYSAGYKFEQV